MAEVFIPETERRQNDISKIDPNHILLQVALLCLKDRDVERPSAQQLCERVAALKESAEYSESVRAARERNTAEQSREGEREREVRRARIKMTWREGRKAPCKMSSPYNAVFDEAAMYVRTSNQEVYVYLTSTSSWSQLPDSPNRNCPSVIVNNLLTLVGGNCRGGGTTNQLFSLTGEGSGMRWTEKLPPMPTKRYGSTALCTGTALIAAGGKNEGRILLKTVEVMNTETFQWSSAADLPQPLCCVPGAVHGDHVYILSLESDSKSMYTCTVCTLIESYRSRTTANVWNKVAAPSLTTTICVSIFDRLLTIGGSDSNYQPTTAVHMYNPTTDSWDVISHMRIPRCDCFVAVLPNNQLMVVGGEIAGLIDTDSVEVATAKLSS